MPTEDKDMRSGVDDAADAPSTGRRQSCWRESMRIGVESVDDKRKAVTELVELLDADPRHAIYDEYFLDQFSRLQVLIAEFFAREEEVIRLIGLPDSDKRRHILEHDRILSIFNQIYVDSMEHKRTMAVEVYKQLRSEIERHITDFDMQLRDYVTPAA